MKSLPAGSEHLRGPLDPFLDRVFDRWVPMLRSLLISPFALTAFFTYVGLLVFDADQAGAFTFRGILWRLAFACAIALALCSMEILSYRRHPRGPSFNRRRWYPVWFAAAYAGSIILAALIWHL